MSSPEFQQQLNEAKSFRAQESDFLRKACSCGLRREASEYLVVLKESPKYQEARKLIMFDRWEKLGEKIPQFSDETWHQTEKVFSGLNNGVKAALFLEIANNTNPGTYMTIGDIVSRFKGLFRGTELLETLQMTNGTKSTVVQSYCEDSFCDVGLLAEKLNDKNELLGFYVTGNGNKYGIPSAKYVLWFENAYNQSLYPLLGQTSTKGKTRSPGNVAKIFDYLARHPNEIRAIDLENNLNLNSPMHLLNNLKNYGLIEYLAVTSQTHKEEVQYGVSKDKTLTEADFVVHSRVLQDEITKVLLAGENQSVGFSQAYIFDHLPDKLKERWKPRILRKSISDILSGLTKQGFLTRINDFKGGEKNSNIQLIQKGRDLYFKFLLPVLSVCSDKSNPEQISQTSKDSNSNFVLYARESAELYYPHSKSHQMREASVYKQSIGETLSKSPKSLTISDLAERLGLHRGTIRAYLEPHVKGSNEIVLELYGQPITIVRENVNRVWYYKVKNSS